MSEIIDRLEVIINKLIDSKGGIINKRSTYELAKNIETGMIPGYASCEQCDWGTCPTTDNACHIKGFRVKE